MEDYEILSSLYKRIKSLQKLQRENTEDTKNPQILELIDESIEKINNLIGNEELPENLRLLAMKVTLFYENSKEVEEENESEQILLNSLKEIQNFMSKSEIIFLTLRIINHYAYLLIKRSDFAKSREILEQAMEIYGEAKFKSSEINFFTSEDLFSSNITITPPSSNKLERLVTNNLQMLAIIYEKCELHEKFAKCSHEVLERQIEMQEDEVLMWPIKAAKLACFFIGKNRFKEARNHLAAATKILSRYEDTMKSLELPEKSEKSCEFQKKIADIANCWVKYGLALFNASKLNSVARFCQDPDEMVEKLWESPLAVSNMKNNEKPDNNPSSTEKTRKSSRQALQTISEDDESSALDGESKKESAEQCDLLLFRELNLKENEEEVTASLIQSTEEARMLFHHTHSWLKRVKLYYTLQDHPIEYVNTIMDLNELYRYLAFYEEDIESQYAVHKLRADALETLSAVLREVRPQCYIAVSIEILRELAEVQMEMMGLNLRRIFAAESSLGDTSQGIVEKIETLRSLHTKLKTFGDDFPEDEKIESNEKEEIEKMEIDEEVSQKSQLPESDDMIMPSTQFYFSQSKQKRNPSTRPARGTLADVIESLFISLEKSNGFLDSEDVKNLTDANAVEIIEKLSQRLSLNGVYNLCCTVCDMETTLATYYAGIICSNLLLKKVIDVENVPDRFLILTMAKIVPKFPDEVRKSLFVPLLITELKSTEIIQKLISNYPQQSKKNLTTDFIETVKDLKMWHITILPFLIDTKIEQTEKSAIISLFVDKALNFADQKSFSQCIMSFMKKHAPFTEEQRNMLHEIIVVHKTIWKKPMQNLFDKMFFHRDLWHIS